VMPADIVEVPQEHENPSQYALRLAEEKARKVYEQHDDAYVIGSDTVVAKGRRIMEKPKDEEEARHFLALLSGSRHRVHTAVCVCAPDGRTSCRNVMSMVRFYRLHEQDIASYIATNEWQGKAGGYAIQGHGGLLVRDIQGCFYAIMGLPISQTQRMLRGLGFRGA
jgi:MAF protein